MADNDVDLNNEAVQAAIKAAVEKAVAEETDGLKRKRDELLAENRKLKDAKPQGGDNVDLEEYKQLKLEKEQREEEAAKKRGEFDKLLKQSQENHVKELTKVTEERDGLKRSLESTVIRYELLASINDEKADAILVMPHLQNRVRFNPESQELEVMTAKGEPMIGDKGERATLKDLHAEFKAHDVLGKCYPGNQHRGTGSRPNSPGGGGVKNPWTKDHMNLTEQGRILRDNPALAAEMKRQAQG